MYRELKHLPQIANERPSGSAVIPTTIKSPLSDLKLLQQNASSKQIKQAFLPKVQQSSTRPGVPPPQNHPPEKITTCIINEDFTPVSPVPSSYATQQAFHSAQAEFASKLAVKKNQAVFAIGKPISGNPTTILISLGDGKSEGYVPLQHVTKGTPLRSVAVKEFAPQYNKTTVNQYGTGDCLFVTINALLIDMKNRGIELKRIGCSSAILEEIEKNGQQLVSIIYNSIVDSTLRIIKNGNANFNDLAKIPSVTPQKDDKTIAIYIMKYKQLENLGHGDNGLYAGKTIAVGDRYDNHMRKLRNSAYPGSHYKIARSAKEKKMLLFATFPPDLDNLHQILQITEQIVQLLLGTMNQILLDRSEDANAESASKWLADKVAARTLTSLASAVFEKTGWKPPPGIQGCNWNSAMREAVSNWASFWLCQDMIGHGGNKMRVFTTGGRAVKLTKHRDDGAIMRLIKGGSDRRGGVGIYISTNMSKETGLSRGNFVYPIVEIYLGNQDIKHPVPFGRLPEPGPYTDWSMLNKVGIRLEWQTLDGEWRSTYVQADEGHLGLPAPESCTTDEEKYASRIYQKVSCIIDSLMNVQYNSAQKPSFKKLGPPLVLKRFAYDHLNQQIYLDDLPKTTISPPSLVSFEHNKVLLRQWYPNIVIGDHRPAKFGTTMGQPRIRCDLCMTAQDYAQNGGCPMTSNRGDPACGDNESCYSCAKLRRPCTFSLGISFRDGNTNPALEGLFQHPRTVGFSVITTPMHMEVGVERAKGPSAEEVDEGEDKD
ncbi:hypothetical protein BGZ57DRAFT_991407 [Hyaloscypha finlandica]|nr:hypothetical protein BGZ57DRAFT_991407 [Hyaloscypha finlandica]